MDDMHQFVKVKRFPERLTRLHKVGVEKSDPAVIPALEFSEPRESECGQRRHRHALDLNHLRCRQKFIGIIIPESREAIRCDWARLFAVLGQRAANPIPHQR